LDVKRTLGAAAIGSVMLCLAAFALASEKKSKPGPLTGTWECVSHGAPQGDMNFTLYLEQKNETVTGTVSSPLGSTELTSASFKKNTLEIHIDTDQRNYLLTGKYKNGHLAGAWSTNEDQRGTWEGKKSAQTTSQP
jgi:hypothetical protein